MYAHFRLHLRSCFLILTAAVCAVLFGAILRQSAAARRNTAVSERPQAETSKEEATRRLPVLMYHSVCDHPKKTSAYILPPALFAEDLAYLKAHGYETVFLRDVLAFAAGEGTLPEKPVALTFDDGCLNALTNALPLLRAAGMKAEINVVGEYTDKAALEAVRSPNYSYLTWEEVRRLQSSGCFEIGCHTYAMHALSPRNGCARMKGETDDAYRAALTADVQKMRDAMLREQTDATIVFAYPYGAVSKGAQGILEKLGFTIFLTCRETVNEIAPNAPLGPLGRFNRTSALSTEDFMKQCGIN